VNVAFEKESYKAGEKVKAKLMVKKPDVSLPNGNVYHYVVKMPLGDGKSMRLEKTFTELDNNGEAEISFYLPNGKYDYFELEMEIYLHF